MFQEEFLQLKLEKQKLELSYQKSISKLKQEQEILIQEMKIKDSMIMIERIKNQDAGDVGESSNKEGKVD